MKRRKILNIVIAILATVLLVLIGTIAYANGNREEQKEKDRNSKIKEEIRYVDSNLVMMINALNNISYESYQVKTEEVSSQSLVDEKKSENADSNGGEDSKKEIITQSMLASNHILNNQRDEIDWDSLKQTIETVYSSWPVIELDLHTQQANSENILSLSSFLKESITNIKQENKPASLISLSNSYSVLTKLAEEVLKDDFQVNLYYTKAHIIQCYSILGTQKNWESEKGYLQDAETRLSEIMKDISLRRE